MDYLDPEHAAFTIEKLEGYRKQAIVNSGLSKALASSSLAVLQEALHKAEELELNNVIVSNVKDRIKQLEEKEKAKAKRASVVESVPTVSTKSPIASFADVEAMRIKRLENATNVRYTYSNYPGLRSKDNFARGSLFNKKAVKDSFLVFTMYEIQKSLTEMKFPDHNKLAFQVCARLLH